MDIALIVVLLLAGMPSAYAEAKACTADTTDRSACGATVIKHGQILSAGQKPPSTTIEQSEKDLAPASTSTVKPSTLRKP